MYIKSLEAKNYRAFEKININFSEGITIIVGHNNSGKTSIIKALYSLQNSRILAHTDVRIEAIASSFLYELDQISEADKDFF